MFRPEIHSQNSEKDADDFPNAREFAQSNLLLNNIVEEVKHSQRGGSFPISQETTLAMATEYLLRELPLVLEEPYKKIVIKPVGDNGDNSRILVRIV